MIDRDIQSVMQKANQEVFVQITLERGTFGCFNEVLYFFTASFFTVIHIVSFLHILAKALQSA